MYKALLGIALAAVGVAVIVSYFLPMWCLILAAGVLLIASGAAMFIVGK